MNRIRPLEPPHLGIRNALGQVSFAIGNTDFDAAEERAALAVLVGETATILRDHARQEDHYIFRPAEAVVPGSTAMDAAMHHQLEREIDEIESTIASFDGAPTSEAVDALISAFRAFHVSYLDHMLHEEMEIEPILLAHQTDEEMIADQGEIMQTVDFGTLLLWFKYIVPARRTADNRQVLSAFKAAAPAEAFDAVCEVLSGVLPAARYHALTTDL